MTDKYKNKVQKNSISSAKARISVGMLTLIPMWQSQMLLRLATGCVFWTVYKSPESQLVSAALLLATSGESSLARQSHWAFEGNSDASNHLKELIFALDGLAHWLGHSPVDQSISGSTPVKDTYLSGRLDL